jgi:hypothetical protein
VNSDFARLRLPHQLPISHSYHPSYLGSHLDVLGDWYSSLPPTFELTQRHGDGFYGHLLTHLVQETIRSATKPYSMGKPSKPAPSPVEGAVSNIGR